MAIEYLVSFSHLCDNSQLLSVHALSYFQQLICSVLFSCSSVSSFSWAFSLVFLFQIFCCFSVKGKIISESSLLLSCCLCCTLSCFVSIVRSGVLSFLFLFQGQRFVGDLLPDGKIKSQETDIVFASPSAWAIHCKRIINPEKKSGCGWASVGPILILSWRYKQIHILYLINICLYCYCLLLSCPDRS